MNKNTMAEDDDEVIDLSDASKLFQMYLMRGKVSFLEKLEKMSMDDPNTSDDETIGPALEALSKFVLNHTQRELIGINLFTLSEFGLSNESIQELGALVILMDKKNGRRSTGSKVTDESVEQYDEDFESLENSGRTVDSNTIIINGQPDSPVGGFSPNPPSVGLRLSRLPDLSPDRASASDTSRSRTELRSKDKEWISRGWWRMGEKIGSGSFGEVFQGLNSKNGQLFAVKRLKINEGQTAELENLANEIDLMRTLSHPNIVAYLGTKVAMLRMHALLCIYVYLRRIH